MAAAPATKAGGRAYLNQMFLRRKIPGLLLVAPRWPKRVPIARQRRRLPVMLVALTMAMVPIVAVVVAVLRAAVVVADFVRTTGVAARVVRVVVVVLLLVRDRGPRSRGWTAGTSTT